MRPRTTASASIAFALGCTLAGAAQAEPRDDARCREIAARLERTTEVDATAVELNDCGNILMAIERFEVAERVYRASAARAWAERAAGAANRVLEVSARANAGAAALEQGRVADLASDLEPTLALALELPESAAKTRILTHLGRSLSRLDERAPDAEGRVLRAASRALARAAETSDDRAASFALGYLAELYAREGRRDEAFELTRRALHAAQNVDALESLYLWQWQLGRLHRETGEIDLAIAAYRQSAETLGRLRGEVGDGATTLRGGFFANARPVYFGLVDLLLQRAASSEVASARRARLAEARDVLESLKVSELEDYFEDECLEAREVAPDAVPDAIVIYPIVLEDRTELILSGAEGLESFTLPIGAARLEAEVQDLRRMLEKRTTRQYQPHAERLYDWLIRPIEPTLRAAGQPVLVFVPDAVLRPVPMAALYDRVAGEFLIEKFPIAITPGLTLTEPRAIDRENVEVLLAGLSDSVQGYPPLPHVESELVAVGDVFGGETLLNTAFVAPALESQLARKTIGIVHIASHAEFNRESDESFLVTYDGKISIERLSELVGITQFRRDPVELLTLSACETAADDPRSALGLAGIALRAGARSAVATLWEVQDRAAAELISEFYGQLGRPERSRAEALQIAQRKLLKTRRYRHPGYWSPFLLISNWL